MLRAEQDGGLLVRDVPEAGQGRAEIAPMGRLERAGLFELRQRDPLLLDQQIADSDRHRVTFAFSAGVGR